MARDMYRTLSDFQEQADAGSCTTLVCGTIVVYCSLDRQTGDS